MLFPAQRAAICSGRRPTTRGFHAGWRPAQWPRSSKPLLTRNGTGRLGIAHLSSAHADQSRVIQTRTRRGGPRAGSGTPARVGSRRASPRPAPLAKRSSAPACQARARPEEEYSVQNTTPDSGPACQTAAAAGARPQPAQAPPRMAARGTGAKICPRTSGRGDRRGPLPEPARPAWCSWPPSPSLACCPVICTSGPPGPAPGMRWWQGSHAMVVAAGAAGLLGGPSGHRPGHAQPERKRCGLGCGAEAQGSRWRGASRLRFVQRSSGADGTARNAGMATALHDTATPRSARVRLAPTFGSLACSVKEQAALLRTTHCLARK